MFTADGELREEYRRAEPEPKEARPADPQGIADERPAAAEESQPGATDPSSSSGRTRGELTLYDLVSVLAQPIAVYLGDAKLPDGETMENLDLARLHIDLLSVLEEKTRGNLTSQESNFLSDLLYQLRLRYVEKRG